MIAFIPVLSALLFVVLLGAQELGRRIGLRRIALEGPGVHSGTGVVEGAVFALLGLLFAFTFTSAASRFDARRDLILQEANAVGTSYLRLDYLDPQDQPDLRNSYRAYLDVRMKLYSNASRNDEHEALLLREGELQSEIWKKTHAALARDGRDKLNMLIVPPINEMFDLSSSRTAATKTHIPIMILALLLLLAVLGAILAGFAMASASRKWVHMIAFATILTLTTHVILDLEYPRYGIIRVDSADAYLKQVRDGMK